MCKYFPSAGFVWLLYNIYVTEQLQKFALNLSSYNYGILHFALLATIHCQ